MIDFNDDVAKEEMGRAGRRGRQRRTAWWGKPTHHQFSANRLSQCMILRPGYRLRATVLLHICFFMPARMCFPPSTPSLFGGQLSSHSRPTAFPFSSWKFARNMQLIATITITNHNKFGFCLFGNINLRVRELTLTVSHQYLVR